MYVQHWKKFIFNCYSFSVGLLAVLAWQVANYHLFRNRLARNVSFLLFTIKLWLRKKYLSLILFTKNGGYSGFRIQPCISLTNCWIKLCKFWWSWLIIPGRLLIELYFKHLVRQLMYGNNLEWIWSQFWWW